MTKPDPTRSSSQVSFPYAFPEAGLYRLRGQVKHRSRVYTGVFDSQVE